MKGTLFQSGVGGKMNFWRSFTCRENDENFFVMF